MAHVPDFGMFAPLSESRPPWKKFFASMGVQTLMLVAFLSTGILYPQVIDIPLHDYHFIQLVNTPPPVNYQPAPLRAFKAPPVAQLELPRPEALRVPPEIRQKLKEEIPAAAPKVNVAENKPIALPPSTPVIPKELVKTNVFSRGSSETPTMARAPQQVQTGGFGDPNGVPAHDNHGNAITIASKGSFDLPPGPGYGNGSGGSRGIRGVVASAGFGNGVAIGDGSGRANISRGTVRQGGFGDAEPLAMQAKATAPVVTPVRILPVEIISKPNPLYTPEARQLRVEGEVLLEVTFQSSGTVRVVRVVQGLGHGLDESAIHAAEQIRFRPAQRDGQPSDSTAVLHIVFQLA